MKRIIALLTVVAVLTAAAVIPSFADEEPVPAGISTIIIGDSYGETTYGGVRDGVEVDLSRRNDGWTNCWTGRLAFKLEPSDQLAETVRSDETGGNIHITEKQLVYSASGRGFASSVQATDYETMIKEVSRYIDPAGVRMIVFGGGANDAKWYDHAKFTARTARMIETAHSIYPNAKLVIAQVGWGKYAEGTLPDDYVPYGNWDDKLQAGTEDVDAGLKEVCGNYSYVYYLGNVGKDVLGGKEDLYFTGRRDNGEGQFDPSHPNYLGGEALAAELYERITRSVHNWGDAVYTWAGDNKTVTARRVCTDPGCTAEETETVEATAEVTKEPTYREAGEVTYTSEPFENEAFSVQTKTEILNKLEISSILRIYGDNRFETSLKAADELKDLLGKTQFDTVILAYGWNYADALAGSYLACVTEAPVLLIDERQDHLDAVRDYIRANLKTCGRIYLLGGEAVVPEEAVAGLAGYTAERLWGKDRYETDLAILRKAAEYSREDEILVCSGRGFADSLSASALGKPILLAGDSLPDSQREYLESAKGELSFCIVGGTGAVSSELETELGAYGKTERIGGSDRYETSAMLARRYFDDTAALVLAYGRTFPDGLCGGALSYCAGAPLLLAEEGRTQRAEEYAAEKEIRSGIVLGGPALISDESVQLILGDKPDGGR